MGMMQQAFPYPFMYWVGMNTPPGTDAAAVAEFSQFYSTIHVPEVVASNPGFVRGTRYELLQPDPRGDMDHGGWRSTRWTVKRLPVPTPPATTAHRRGVPSTRQALRCGNRR